MMPKRRHTRAADRARRVSDERALNAAQIPQYAANNSVERNKPPPPPDDPCDNWDVEPGADIDEDPPPF